MKKTLFGLLAMVVCVPAFASNVAFTVSKNSKVEDGGLKRVGGLVSGQDIGEFGSSRSEIAKTSPYIALEKGASMTVSGYEMRHLSDNGRENFEITIRLYGPKELLATGLVSSVDGVAAADGTVSYYNLNPDLVIRSSNYAYVKDLIAKLKGDSSVTINCLIEKGEVITLLEGEGNSDIFKIGKVSCH